MLFKNKRIFWAFLLTLAFICANIIAMARGTYLVNLVPLALVIVGIAFIRLDWIFFFIVFCVPLSLQLSTLIPDLPFDLFLPTEPLLAGVLFLMILKILYEGTFDSRILNHPVTLAIFFNLFWIFVTSITSTIPLVSFKALLARMWFLATFYFLATQVFQKKKNIFLFWWMYLIPFTIVIIYTIIRHISFGLDQATAHFVMNPFFRDHTSYGAVLAMFIPVLVALAVWYHRKGNLLQNIVVWVLTVLFLLATVLSYTRAAWLSLAVALLVFLIILFRVRFSILAIGASVLVGLFFAFQSQIMIKMETNRQDSSTNLAKHLRSMSNIASDASNLERINRWHSAIAMFREEPVFGFGPGTYMFQYAPYQQWYEKTIISTNFGTQGNAHSEYIGPLSESGFLGMLSIIAILLTTIYTAVKVYYRASKSSVKIIVLASILGLITYYIHGLMNNFLDTDKASAPFWGFTAIIVALDIYHHKKADLPSVKQKP